jgi:hypothetical protein
MLLQGGDVRLTYTQADDLLRPAVTSRFFIHMNDDSKKGCSQCGQLLVVDGHAKVGMNLAFLCRANTTTSHSLT